MTTQQDNIQHLKRLIRIELEACNSDHWPEVCRLQSTPEGYDRIEEQIIQLAILEGMPVGPAIAQLEQDFAHDKPQDHD